MTETQADHIHSEKEFYDFLFRTYTPSEYEVFEENNTRFKSNIHYQHVIMKRGYMVYREIATSLPNGGSILDIGFYPGTIVRELKMLLGDKVTLAGVGLNIDEKFQAAMRPYMDGCVDVELDPFYNKSDKPIRMPIEDETFDAVIATDVLEHLISPLEMIAEGARILKPNGIFIVTTPNVSHIGAVIRLLCGRSNYERLHRSPMFLQNDPWRGHIRFYDRSELRELFQNSGLSMIKHEYYVEKGWSYLKMSAFSRVVSRMKVPFRLIPFYKDEHFAVFRKSPEPAA